MCDVTTPTRSGNEPVLALRALHLSPDERLAPMLSDHAVAETEEGATHSNQEAAVSSHASSRGALRPPWGRACAGGQASSGARRPWNVTCLPT
jgi:hypothetical protein